MESEAAAPIVSEGGFSLFGLLMDADIVVKLVLIILLIASLWSWAVIIEKSFTVSRARKRAKAFEDAFWSGRADDLDRRGAASGSDAASRIYASITREWTDARRAPESEGHMMMIDRAERSLRAGVDREVGRVSNGLGVLATIGSASPFIGLFGTVWGIMNSFFQIGAQESSSLAVVAPGISEALFATAIGLFAAIPAVIAYNRFSHRVDRYEARLQRFADKLNATFSRQLEAR